MPISRCTSCCRVRQLNHHVLVHSLPYHQRYSLSTIQENPVIASHPVTERYLHRLAAVGHRELQTLVRCVYPCLVGICDYLGTAVVPASTLRVDSVVLTIPQHCAVLCRHCSCHEASEYCCCNLFHIAYFNTFLLLIMYIPCER